MRSLVPAHGRIDPSLRGWAAPERPQPLPDPEPSWLVVFAAPMVLTPIGFLAWIGTLLIAMAVSDYTPIVGLLGVTLAWAFPCASRLAALALQGRWALIVGLLAVPLAVTGGLAAMVAMVLWDTAFLAGPPPTDRALWSMTMGYFAFAGPVALGQAVVEAVGAGAATRFRTGAGLTAASMVIAWLLASTVVVAGFAYEVQGSETGVNRWAPWAACDVGLVVTFLGPVPGAFVGSTLANLRRRKP